jgi:uncharacterized protein (DUF927 family)
MDTQDELADAIENGSIADGLANAPAHMTFGPFAMTEDGLTANISTGSGKNRGIKTVRVSDPFDVLGCCRDAHGGSWGKMIRFHDADGVVKTHHVAEAMLHGEPATLAGELGSQGLRIDRVQQRAFAEYLNAVEPPGRVTLVNRTGWHEIRGERVFVLPDETIGSDALGEAVVLDGVGSSTYVATGDLDAWKAGVGALTTGQPWAILAVSAALAGPLAHLVGAEGGGVHFYGPSSIGKSTLLAAAGSVWGRGGTPGYVSTWRATANGLESAAANAADTCYLLDELSTAAARDVDPALYTLANGTGKQRARRDGSAQERRTWSVMLISSGEVTIEAKIAEDHGRRARAGQTVRVLHIPADRGLGFGVFDNAGVFAGGAELVNAINAAATTAYGTAGPALIRRLIAAGLGKVSAWALKRIDKFVCAHTPQGASEQVGRVARKFALIAVAGELAISLKIVPWAKDEAWDAAALALGCWINARGGIGSHEDRQAIEQVRLVIEQHGDARFEPLTRTPRGLSPDANRPVPNRLGWRLGAGAAQHWFVTPEAWKTEVCKGLDSAAVGRALAKHGMLLRPKVGRDLSFKISVEGNRVRVYVITAAILA